MNTTVKPTPRITNVPFSALELLDIFIPEGLPTPKEFCIKTGNTSAVHVYPNVATPGNQKKKMRFSKKAKVTKIDFHLDLFATVNAFLMNDTISTALIDAARSKEEVKANKGKSKDKTPPVDVDAMAKEILKDLRDLNRDAPVNVEPTNIIAKFPFPTSESMAAKDIDQKFKTSPSNKRKIREELFGSEAKPAKKVARKTTAKKAPKRVTKK